MKKVIVLLLVLIVSLSGCAVKTLAQAEYVTDVWLETPACEYVLHAGIPLRMLLTASTDDGMHTCYVQDAGDYEMTTDICTATPGRRPETRVSLPAAARCSSTARTTMR